MATSTYDPEEELKKANANTANQLAAQQQPQYQAYDYSNVLNAANQAPAQHQNYDYGKSLGYADRAMQTNNMGQATNVNAVQSQINKAANTLSNPTFQDSGLVGQLTGDILSNLAPVRQQQQNAINQQFDASKRALQEAQAASGGVRSGAGINQLMGLEQARNQQLAQAQAGLVQGALAQALPFGQLALSEKGLLQGQQQTAANQLASLLGQQESSRQWAEGFNADQLQKQFANTFAAQQAQAGENQFGSQFNANQIQQQLANLMAANQLAADENRYGQQFEHGKDIDAANLLGIYGGQQTLAAQQLANQLAQQALANKYTEAGLTGRFQDASGNWVDTLPGQQLANQLAQQALANKYTEAGLTGRFQDASGNWVDTLAGQQLQQQKDSAADMLATQLLSAYLSNSPNAAVPQSAINWINQMFGR